MSRVRKAASQDDQDQWEHDPDRKQGLVPPEPPTVDASIRVGLVEWVPAGSTSIGSLHPPVIPEDQPNDEGCRRSGGGDRKRALVSHEHRG